jgi:MFS family permease
MTHLRSFGTDTFRSLRSRNHRLFFIGQALSQNGTWMQLVAIDILVLRLTDDGVAVGIATAARLAPILLLGAWGGVLSDRSDRHKLLFGLNVAGATLAGAFAVTVATGAASLGWIYVLAAASGVVTALENPARRAFVVELVDEEDVTNAVGLNSAMFTGAKVTGPAVAGLLITTVGIEWCFAVNALSFLPQLWMFTRLDRSGFRASDRVAKAKGQLREGLRYVWGKAELRQPIVLLTAVGIMTMNYPVILPLFATRDLHAGAGTYTLLLSVMSVGSVVGGLTVARRSEVSTRFLAHATVALAGATLALAVAPVTAVAALLVVPVGVTTMLVNTGANTVVQLASAPAMRGRVLAILTVVFVGSTPVGAPIVGWIAEHAGARWALAIGGLTALLTALATLRSLRAAGEAGPVTDAPHEAPSRPVVAAGR